MSGIIKTAKGHTIIKKRSGRYGVRRPNGTWINGADKIKILSEEGLIKAAKPTAKPAAPEESPKEEAKESGDSPQD